MHNHSTESPPHHHEPDSDGYPDLLAGIRSYYAHMTGDDSPLYVVNSRKTPASLFDLFLNMLPAESRQGYTCNACRRFVDRFGALVTIDAHGLVSSALWGAKVPPLFSTAVGFMRDAVESGEVEGVFLTEETAWGVESNEAPSNEHEGAVKVWRHMSLTPKAEHVYHRAAPLNDMEEYNKSILSADQAMAKKTEDFKMLRRGLSELKIEHVRQAHTMLSTEGALDRREKCIGVAKWLLDLKEAIAATKRANTEQNLIWRAVATAPAGFCNVRSTMISTLLEDIAAGYPYEVIRRRFNEKVDPTKYQRPVAPPSAGNLAQAEKLMASMGTAGALSRRFAKLGDIHALWAPKQISAPPAKPGLFAHLAPKPPVQSAIELPTVTMTWTKFSETVLPAAETIEFRVPHTRTNYVGMVTAAEVTAPPILQWDTMSNRNPVSWYFYAGGRSAREWNLTAGSWCPVTAVTLQPSMWHGGAFQHQGKKVFFLLQGARDMSYESGAGFFVETLKAEYHGIRSTLEAYAKNAVVSGIEEGTAFGLGLQAEQPWGHEFRVTANGARTTYKLDRWD